MNMEVTDFFNKTLLSAVIDVDKTKLPEKVFFEIMLHTQLSISPTFYQTAFSYESVLLRFSVHTVCDCNFFSGRKWTKKLLAKCW